MISEPVLSHITFDLEVDDHKPVDLKRETISFACQFVKSWSSHNEMNLDMIRPRSKTEVFLISLTKNCETLIKQTLIKTQGTLDFKNSKSRDFFWYKPSSNLGPNSNWMVALTNLEVNKSFLEIRQKINKLELYTHTLD